MASVKVTISKVGRIRMQPEGYTGTDCKDATRALEHAYRGAEVNETILPEMSYTGTEQTHEAEQEME